jgi:hypothetical protein
MWSRASSFRWEYLLLSLKSSSRYLPLLHRLQVSQSKCLRVIGNYPRPTPIPYLHAALSIPPIQEFIYRLTFHFHTRCPTHPNPSVRSNGDYTLPDLLHQYKKYLHKRPKHILLWSHTLLLQCFFFCAIFSLLCLPSPDKVAPWPPRTASVLQEIGWPGTIFVLSGTEVCVFTSCK